MSVYATEGVAPGLLAMAPSSAAATQKGEEDQQMFLELLVAQLQYQDPLNPTDTGEFLSQNAQFTAMETMQKVADATHELVAVQMAFGASGMIGRNVTWTAADGTERSGLVSGARFLATGPVLEVGGEQVPIAGVTSVATAAPAPSTGTGTSPGTGIGTPA